MSQDIPDADEVSTTSQRLSVDSAREMTPPPTSEESKFIQQHLANERTFLAWIRTVIAILGVGFITANLHFELTTGRNPYANVVIETLGIVTVLIGLITVYFTASSYMRKRRGINTGAFQSTGSFVIFLSVSITVLVMVMFAYLLFAF